MQCHPAYSAGAATKPTPVEEAAKVEDSAAAAAIVDVGRKSMYNILI